MSNTGPPWFAADQAEADRALTHTRSALHRRAFAAQLQGTFRGNAQRALQTIYNWTPLRRTS